MPKLIAHEIADAPGWLVACLCADWCTSCRAYRETFEAVADSHGTAAFVWMDIEDDSDWLGDVEVENFPTLLIAHGGAVHFFGAMLPHAEQLARLLLSAQSDPAPLHAVDDELQRLTLRLQAWVSSPG